MIYFPVARTLDKDNNEITLSVYVGYVNKESALKQFELWSEGYGYELEDCRIDCFDSYEMVDCLKVERHFLIITDTPQTDCEGCKHSNTEKESDECYGCSRYYTDKYEPQTERSE